MKNTKDLDRLDWRILDALQRNGRIAITELASKVALSATACTERVRRLERDGVIRGYHAHLDPARVGKKLLVFVELKMSAKSDEVFERVKQQITHVPEVLECHLVSGDFDYLVKLRLSEMSEYRHILGKILLKLPSATESRSYIVMEEIKETTYLRGDG